MKNCKELYWICTNTHYKNIFNTTHIEIAMTVLAKNMILDGLY